MPPHLQRCQGFAVAYYSFTLGRLEAGAPSTFAQSGFYLERDRLCFINVPDHIIIILRYQSEPGRSSRTVWPRLLPVSLIPQLEEPIKGHHICSGIMYSPACRDPSPFIQLFFTQSFLKPLTKILSPGSKDLLMIASKVSFPNLFIISSI